MKWLVYILELSNGSYYTGITNDLDRRIKKHKSGKGSKYVRSHLPFSVVYRESALNRSVASKREFKIKKLTRKQKEQLIKERSMSDFAIQPLFDRVFIKKDSEEFTKGGIVLPKSVKGRAVTGTVVAAGPGQRNHLGDYISMTLNVGDRVYVKEFTGYIVRYKNEEVHVFQENEIIGLLADGE